MDVCLHDIILTSIARCAVGWFVGCCCVVLVVVVVLKITYPLQWIRYVLLLLRRALFASQRLRRLEGALASFAVIQTMSTHSNKSEMRGKETT